MLLFSVGLVVAVVAGLLLGSLACVCGLHLRGGFFVWGLVWFGPSWLVGVSFAACEWVLGGFVSMLVGVFGCCAL